jgi:hypothetical protein
MSLAVTEPLQIPQELAFLGIAGDAADFEDADLLEFAGSAPPGVPVRVVRLYQFAADLEPVRLVVELTAAVLAGVPANLIADWLKHVIGSLRHKASFLDRQPAWDVRFRQDPEGAIEFEGRF